MNRPVDKNGQHASALRYADPYTQALLTAIVDFALQPHGFTRAQLAACVDTQSGTTASPGRMTYDSRPET